MGNNDFRPEKEEIAAGTEAKKAAPTDEKEELTETRDEKGELKETRLVSEENDTEYSKTLREQFRFFGPATLLYAVWYAFCMYKNYSGVTFPFFVAGSLLFFFCSLTKLGITYRKENTFYAGIMMLLAISTFCTDDARIIFFNGLGVVLLLISILLNSFFDISKWGLGKYLGSIVRSIFGLLGELGRPFHDFGAYIKTNQGKKNKGIIAVGVGFLCGLPLVLVVLCLLSSADVYFRSMTDKIIRLINVNNVFGVLLHIVLLFLAVYGLLSFLCKKILKESVTDRRKGEPIIAITITTMLTLLYLIFSGIQIMGLFFRKMELPEGYTYAAYAREGFFQLLAVGLLNLVIVLVCLTYFRKSNVLRIILTVMSFCTFVMNFSSAMRMMIYIKFYYLTFLRILVLWALLLLTLLFVGVVINIFREDFRLFRYSCVVVSLMYVVLSFSHPDYLIARYNVSRIDSMTTQQAGGEEIQPYKDYSYLSNLSADAAPILIPFYKEQQYDFSCFYTGERPSKEYGLGEKRSYHWMERMHDKAQLNIRTFNVSRFIMKQMMK